MDVWQFVWRKGFQPQLGEGELAALRDALRADDPALVQGHTTLPPHLAMTADCPPEGACAVGVCGWRGRGLATVAEVGRYVAMRSYVCDAILEIPGAFRAFAAYFDGGRRREVFAELLAEVEAELARRSATSRQRSCE